MQADVLQEANDYLYGAGDPAGLALAYVDVLRDLGMSLPLWSDVRILYNTWSFLQVLADGTTTDLSSQAQGSAPGAALSTLATRSGHLIRASAKFDTIDYTVNVDTSVASGVYSVSYWDGLQWQPLTVLETPDFGTLTVDAATVQRLRFVMPEFWEPNTPAGLTLPSGFTATGFWVRVLATSPPDTVAAIAQVAVHLHTWVLDPGDLKILALTFYPSDLTETEVAEALEVVLPDWRTAVGTPRVYHQDQQTALEVRLVPSPAAIGVTGLPFLSGWPDEATGTNHLVVATNSSPQEAQLPEWAEGLVAWRVAAREARRLSELASPDLADGLTVLSQLAEGLYQAALEEELR